MDPQFIFCGTIGSHRIFFNDLLLKLQVDERYVEFSRMEYSIIKLLLSGQFVTDTRLIREVYGSTEISIHLEPLTKHIERLRKKLQPYGLVIPRVSRYGYLLHSTENDTITT
jgi:DNA-binding response OmpR family regulator